MVLPTRLITRRVKTPSSGCCAFRNRNSHNDSTSPRRTGVEKPAELVQVENRLDRVTSFKIVIALKKSTVSDPLAPLSPPTSNWPGGPHAEAELLSADARRATSRRTRQRQRQAAAHTIRGHQQVPQARRHPPPLAAMRRRRHRKFPSKVRH